MELLHLMIPGSRYVREYRKKGSRDPLGYLVKARFDVVPVPDTIIMTVPIPGE